MVKVSDPCVWFVGGWVRRGLAVILPSARVVLGPISLSEFRKSFEIHQFLVKSLPPCCELSVSYRGIGLFQWFEGVACFRVVFTMVKLQISNLERVVRNTLVFGRSLAA